MNPLIPTVFSADPSAHVWPGDDRLWIYASHDEPGTNTHDSMTSYHVFSSTDLVNWIDYGPVLHLKDVKWAISHMWAIDAVLWKGRYYLVFCAVERASGLFKTGLAVSDRPQGPFEDIGFIQGMEIGQDPALFVDDDGTPYLFWGQGGSCSACRLSDDLLHAVPGTTVDLTAQLTWVFEGPWVHKHLGKYYLSYPGLKNGNWPETMFYATADHPLGPYSFQGEYIPYFDKQAGTNHGSILEYKGRWYAFHHSMWQTGLSECRSLMCDYLDYDAEGRIVPIKPTTEGVAAPGHRPGPSRVVIQLDAACAPLACGQFHDIHVAREHPGFVGPGYVTGFERKYSGVTFMTQAARETVYKLRIRYRSPAGPEKLKVMVNNSTLLDDPAATGYRWDKHLPVPAAADWTELDLGPVTLRSGDNTLKLYTWEGARNGLCLDRLWLEPVTP